MNWFSATRTSVLLAVTTTAVAISAEKNDFSVSSATLAAESGSQQERQLRSKEDIGRYFRDFKGSATKSEKTRSVESIVQPVSNPLQLDVPFDFNSAELTPSAKQQLDELGEVLASKEFSNVCIELAGHTDERGTEEYNLELSRRRAESAKRYIVDKYKVDPARILAKGYGESRPLIVNAGTEAEHAVNRRVEMSPLDENESSAIESQKKKVIGHESATTPKEKPDGDGLPGREGVSVKWGVLHVEGRNNVELLQYDGSSTLKSEDAYRIFVHPQSRCHVYIYQVDSKGKGAWLFPQSQATDANPLSVSDHWLPSRNTTFTLDKNVGLETVYLVASRSAASDLESYINGNATATSEVITQSIKVRGLGEIKIGPPPGMAKEESISITHTSKKAHTGLSVGPPPDKGGLPSSQEIAEVMSKSGEFYVKIEFKHD
jgi:outer membrane protein OmpA-like peptidoglycan-associated protein